MNSQSSKRRLVLVASLASVLATVGCTFAGGKQSVPYGTDRYPIKEVGAPIVIYAERPGRPFLLLGTATAHADVKFYGFWSVVQTETAIENLKQIAREMGGDALFDVESYTAPVGSVGAGGVTIQGKVIRWK